MKRLMLVLFALALLVGMPLQAAEKELARYNHRGEYGQVSYTQQADDCIWSTFRLGWNIDQTTGRDKADPTQYGWVQVHYDNQCTGQEKFRHGSFDLSSLNLVRAKNMTAATLQGWTTVTWWIGDTEYTEEIYVDLSWNMRTERSRGTWATTWEEGSFGTRSHNSGESRSGSVTGTIGLNSGTIFIESGWGTLGKNASGTMVVYKITDK